MDSVPPALLGSLAPVVQQQLPGVFTQMDEEDLEVEGAWKSTTQNFYGKISGLNASNEADETQWQVDRASLLAAAEAAKDEERRRLQASLLQMAQQAQEVHHQATLLRMAPAQGKRSATQAKPSATLAKHSNTQAKPSTTLAKHSNTQAKPSTTLAKHSNTQAKPSATLAKRPTMGPRPEQLELERVRAWSGTRVVDATSAFHKQRILGDLKEQAAMWMEAPVAAGESNTPVVFQTWAVREQWRKVQANRPVLNDQLQAFLHKDAIEKQVRQNAQIERELHAQFEMKRRSLESKFLKKEEKLRAAAEEKNKRLEQQVTKEAEKRTKCTTQNFYGEISGLNASNEADETQWQVERASLLAAAEAAKEEERRRLQASLLQMAQQAQEVHHQATLLRMAPAQGKRSTMGPRPEQLELERVRAWSCTLVVDATSTFHKQRILADLKEQAAMWMEAPMAAGESNTPVVFQTWGVREQWRKVQANRHVLNDQLQAFLHKDAIEKQVRQNAQIERELHAQFEMKRRSLENKFLKKEEKLRAAAEEKNKRLEQQVTKEAEKRITQNFYGEISGLNASNEADETQWQVERASLLAAAEAAKEEERRRLQASLLQMAQQAQEVHHQATLLRMAPAQGKRSTMGPRPEQLELERVRAWSCTLVVDATSTFHKQRILGDLKKQAAMWMEAPMAAGESNTPVVFQTWGVREQWRKVQANRPVLNDQLQAFLHKEAIEKQVRQNAQIERELHAQFEMKRRSLENKFLKKEEKLRAAAEEKKERLEKQVTKEAEKRARAAAKAQKKRVEKERKEAEKRMRAAAKAEKKREEKERKEAEKADKQRAKEEKKEAERQRRRERRERGGSSSCGLFSCFRRSETTD